MTKPRSRLIEPSIPATALVVRVRVGGDVAIDLLANAALRWLCRSGFSPAARIVGVSASRR